MKFKQLWMSCCFVVLGLGGLYAQEAVVPTGGEALGTGGGVSYSIGQIAYQVQTSTQYSLIQGVQQPFEISMVGIEKEHIRLKATAFPNPTRHNLTLSLEHEPRHEYSFRLADLTGNQVRRGELTEKQTVISMHDLSAGAYFLFVDKLDVKMSTFKIIKQ